MNIIFKTDDVLEPSTFEHAHPWKMGSNQLGGKTIGAYRIATQLRHLGRDTIVVDYVPWLLRHYPGELLNYVYEMVNEDTQFFGISTTFINHSTDIMDLAVFVKMLKKYFPDKKIIMGGAPNKKNTELYETVKDDIDCRVTGFGELAIGELLENIDNLPKEFVYDPLGMKYDFRNSEGAFRPMDRCVHGEILPMDISRGCRFKCKFCSHPLLGRSEKDLSYLRSSDAILSELRHNYEDFGTTRYFFTCDTFNASTEKLLDIKRAIDEFKIDIEFACYLRLDLLHAYPDQIKILQDMGIKGASFGIETLNDTSGKVIGKGLGAEKVSTTLRKVKDQWKDDIFISSGFIAGLPHETPASFGKWAALVGTDEYPLDGFIFYALSLRQDEFMYPSEFEVNAEKYGYTLLPDTKWKSTHGISTIEEAEALSDYWNDYHDLPDVLRTAWSAFTLNNFDISWKDIKTREDEKRLLPSAVKEHMEKYKDSMGI